MSGDRGRGGAGAARSGLAELTDEQIRAARWYYKAELRPGVFTGGRERLPAAMVRELLGRVDVDGTRCLDIGTQEGAISVDLARLGARSVVAYDRLDLTDRVNLVKEAYGVDFDYRCGIQLPELSPLLAGAGLAPFDVVVFAGVLYHMVDPLAGLARARSFVRENGIVVLETAARVRREMALYFNPPGTYYASSCYFLPSVGWLDYALRMLALEPIECVHLKGGRMGSVCRVGIVCRALARPLAFPTDDWMSGLWLENDLRAFALDFDAVASTAPEVGYRFGHGRRWLHRETGSVDVFKSVRKGKPLRPRVEKARLNLADGKDRTAS